MKVAKSIINLTNSFNPKKFLLLILSSLIVLIKTKKNIMCSGRCKNKNKIKNDEDEIRIEIHDKLTESPCNKCNKKIRSLSFDEYCENLNCECCVNNEEDWGFFV